jgi:4-amino-4-deoxy-L-arabinose transferase-like glycosyltransferase
MFADKSFAFLKDFRFWIVLFFIARLYGIWFPPIDISHNWRQTTVTMVARNFLEINPNPFYPRLDISGELSGITGMEFPLLNYLSYLLSLVFGYQHWYGRLIVLIVSSFGLFYFYKLVKSYFEAKVAFNASIVLLFSIWFTYSRKIMPDTFSLSLILFALWHALEYFKSLKLKNLSLYLLFLALGTLSKMPSAYLLILLIHPFLNRSLVLKNKAIFAVSSIITLSVCMTWYYLWVPYLNETYKLKHFFMGKSMRIGATELWQHMDQALNKFYEVALKFIAFAFLLFGLFMAFKNKNKIIFYILGLGFIGFLPIMVKGGFTFYHHSYYIIPFVPIMALVSGYGIAEIKNNIASKVVLVCIGIEGCLNHIDDFVLRENYKPILTLESAMDKVSKPNELTLINSGAYPTPLYFAHRKGWVAFNEQLQRPEYIDSLVHLGLKHIVVMKHVFGDDIVLPYQEVYNDSAFRIYNCGLKKD